MEKVIPKRVKIAAPHFKFLPTSNSHLEYLFFPIQTKLVLSVFIFKPDTDPKISKTFNAASRDCLLPSNIKSHIIGKLCDLEFSSIDFYTF